MRGRPTCPTEQKKNSVGATGGSPLFLLLQGKVGYQIAPSSDPASPAHLPPKGKALGVGTPLPVCETTPPSPPSRGAGRYGRKIQGRRPGRIKKTTSRLAKTRERWVQGGRNSSSLVFFPPAFFQRKPGSRPESGGKPRRRARPAPVQAWTTCRYRDPQDKKEEPQWKSNNSS